MLKNALIFAVAALVIAFSAPSLLPERVGAPAASKPAAPAAAVPPVPVATDAAASEDSGFREASIAADAGGQFRASALIEGQEVEVMVDTGATMVALTADTAARLGVVADPAAPKVRTHTANGDSFVSPVVLKQVSLGSIYMNDVDAWVMAPGAGTANLLGASFLKRLAAVEQRDGVLVLKQ
ncbi:MAG: TIGR02281 family clan AA aspartic protease [Roseiarcus sp.]